MVYGVISLRGALRSIHSRRDAARGLWRDYVLPDAKVCSFKNLRGLGGRRYSGR